MCALRNRNGSDSDSEVNIDDFNIEESVGWNASTKLDRYIKNKDVDRSISKKLVQQANRLVSLSSVINKYGIQWTRVASNDGWTHKSCCPFPDHEDGTPSFGYNTRDGRFYCFGCRRAGNAVQFLAYMQRRQIVDVAKEILCKVKDPEQLIQEIDNDQDEKTDLLLRRFSIEIREFIYANVDNPKTLRYVEALTWNLHVFLEKHVMTGTINLESLSARIEKLREHMKAFGK